MAVEHADDILNDILDDGDGFYDDVGETAVPLPILELPEIEKRRPSLIPLMAVFLVGIILGWLLIGWWLWPVRWINTQPHDLSPEYQKIYIGLVASEYWLTRDVSRVQTALSPWDEQVLAGYLAEMIANATDAEERQRLTLLTETLALPDAQVTVYDLLSGQKLIFLSIGVSILLLLGAVFLTILPTVQKRKPENGQVAVNIPDVETDQLTNEPGETLDDDLTPVQKIEAAESTPLQEDEADVDAQQTVSEAETEVQTEENQDEAEPEKSEEQPDVATAPPDDEDDPYLVLDEDEEDDEPEESGGDPLFDIFEEEDTRSAEIEGLAQGLPEIDMTDLLQMSQDVIDRFRNGVRR